MIKIYIVFIRLEQSLNDIVCTVIKKEIENILEDKLIPAATAAALQSNIKHHEVTIHICSYQLLNHDLLY